MLSSWCERTALEAADAVIAVSAGMMRDVLAAYPSLSPDRVRVVHNGIDTDQYGPDRRTDVLERLGVDPDQRSVTFVGRITRQKGLPYLLRAARIAAAGGAAHPAGRRPGHARRSRPRWRVSRRSCGRRRKGVVWVQEMLPKDEVIQVLTHSTVFVCPSVYEPMGIVNLEAMACETAVVATATGGIPEVVVNGVDRAARTHRTGDRRQRNPAGSGTLR